MDGSDMFFEDSTRINLHHHLAQMSSSRKIRFRRHLPDFRSLDVDIANLPLTHHAALRMELHAHECMTIRVPPTNRNMVHPQAKLRWPTHLTFRE